MRREDLRAAGWIGAGLLGLAALVAWQGFTRRRRAESSPGLMPDFDLAVGFLRCPRCNHAPLAGKVEARDLVCPSCSACYPYRSGFYDFLAEGAGAVQTISQRAFQWPALVAAYDRLRISPVAWLFTGYSFRQEAGQLLDRLEVKDGDPILDVACGPANFTIELARRHPHSLVFGLDLSPAQLRRARRNLDRAGIRNVLLVRGDAENLPFRNGVIKQISNCGGLHQLPGLKRAVEEAARVLKPGGHFAGLTLAAAAKRGTRRLEKRLASWLELNVVDMQILGALLNESGLEGYEYHMSRWIGYFRARKALVAQPAGR